MSKSETALKPEVVELLRGGSIATLVTIDRESKKPQLSVVSWVYAVDGGKQIKIAVGHKGSSIDNIMADPYVIIGTMGPESCYAVKGKATVSDIYPGTMKYRVITVDVEEVDDVMFYGGKLTSLPTYEKTYDAQLVKKLDDEVYALLTANL